MSFNWLTHTFPNKAWYDKNVITPLHTPDITVVEQKEFAYLFEYGELMTGMPRHKSFLTNPVVTPAFTVQKFELWRHNQESSCYPIAMKLDLPGKDVPKAKVRGQLYLVPWESIVALDNYRENGVTFNRQRAHLHLYTTDNCGRPHKADAWMYIGNAQHWREQISWDSSYFRGREGADFSLVRIYEDNKQAWINRYYGFTDDQHVGLSKKNRRLHFVRNAETQQYIQAMDYNEQLTPVIEKVEKKVEQQTNQK